MERDPADLIEAYFSGELDDAGAAELRAWLREDETRFEQFAAQSRIEAVLNRVYQARQLQDVLQTTNVFDHLNGSEEQSGPAFSLLDAPSFIHEEDEEKPVSIGKIFSVAGYIAAKQLRAKVIQISSVAAVLVIGLVLYMVLSGPGDTPESNNIVENVPSEPSPVAPAGPIASPIVATLTAEYNAQWQTSSGEVAPSVGDEWEAGRRLVLTDGVAEVTTGCGTVVSLQGPAEVRTHGESRVELIRGKLVARCETSESKGFTVFTDTAEITDIGTVFGVERLASGQTTAGVLSGHVVLTYTMSNDEPQLLKTGDVAGVSANGLAIASTPDDVRQVFQSWGEMLRPVTVTGDAVFEDSMPRELPEDEKLARVYRESTGVLLDKDLVVSRTEPGLYRPVDGNQQTTILAGTHVDSYFVHIDRLQSHNFTTKKFTIQFDQPVVALVVHTSLLTSTHQQLGHPDVSYPKAGGLGLVSKSGFGPDNPQVDSIQWSDDRKTLTVTLNVQNVDQFRVLTLSPEAASAEGNRD